MTQTIIQTWGQRTYFGDQIHQHFRQILEQYSDLKELPKFERTADARLIVNNVSGEVLRFLNPGQHSDSLEVIPTFDGSNAAAVMIMLAGASLPEQLENAKHLAEKYNLHAAGFSSDFLEFMKRVSAQDPEATGFITEAYGPAPFEGQAKRLVPALWRAADDGADVTIDPVITGYCAYGVRPAESVIAYRIVENNTLKGTVSVPERLKSEGSVLQVTENKDGTFVTRPIDIDVAKGFFGADTIERMPRVIVTELHGVSYVANVQFAGGPQLEVGVGFSRRHDRRSMGASFKGEALGMRM